MKVLMIIYTTVMTVMGAEKDIRPEIVDLEQCRITQKVGAGAGVYHNDGVAPTPYVVQVFCLPLLPGGAEK
jgi:hypothetical protein